MQNDGLTAGWCVQTPRKKTESLTSSAMVGTTCFVWCKASSFAGKCHQTRGVRTAPWFEGPKLCFIWLSIKGTVVDFRGVFRKQKTCQNCKFFIDELCKFSPNWHFFIDKFCKFCWKIAGIKSWQNVWMSFSPYSDYLIFGGWNNSFRFPFFHVVCKFSNNKSQHFWLSCVASKHFTHGKNWKSQRKKHRPPLRPVAFLWGSN